MCVLRCESCHSVTDLDDSLYGKPSLILGCIHRSKMSRALEAMTLYSASETEFGVWVFGVHCLSASKVNQVHEGPGDLRIWLGEAQTKENSNG